MIINNSLKEVKPICELTHDENFTKSVKLIARSSSIIGFKMIPEEDYLKDLAECIIEFIFEFNYIQLSWDEIYLALKINSLMNKKELEKAEFTFIPVTTSHFNVSYLSDCLQSYLLVRKIVQKKVENMINGIMPNQRSFK